MKMSDHCEEICVKALISKNNSTCENAVSQTLYGSWTLRVMGSCFRWVGSSFTMKMSFSFVIRGHRLRSWNMQKCQQAFSVMENHNIGVMRGHRLQSRNMRNKVSAVSATHVQYTRTESGRLKGRRSDSAEVGSRNLSTSSYRKWIAGMRVWNVGGLSRSVGPKLMTTLYRCAVVIHYRACQRLPSAPIAGPECMIPYRTDAVVVYYWEQTSLHFHLLRDPRLWSRITPVLWWYNTEQERCDFRLLRYPSLWFRITPVLWWYNTEKERCDFRLLRDPSLWSRTTAVLSGTIQRKKAVTSACCGAGVYNSSSQLCCNGTIQTKPHCFYECCGDQDYDPGSHLCCGGTIQNNPDGNYYCCGNQVYDSIPVERCNGKLQPRMTCQLQNMWDVFG